MTEETPTQVVLDEAEFDFSLENFRHEGYKMWATVTTAEVRAVPEQTHKLNEPRTLNDGTVQTEFTKPAENRLVIWARPDNTPEDKADWKIIETKFSMDKKSKMFYFVEQTAKAGVTFKKPSELIGRRFQFESIEGLKLGNFETGKFFVIRAEDKGAAGVTSAPASTQTLSDELAAQLARVLSGVENNTTALIGAVSASPLRTESKVMAAVASGQALRELQSRGLVRAEGSTLVLV